MLVTITLCALGLQAPVDTLRAIHDAYSKLESFAATLQHHNSSGLFPGEYTQRLRWRKGNQFELVVTKPSAKPPPEPGTHAPDYYAKGGVVVTILRDGNRSERSLATEPNTMPGWEVAGGPVLWFLLGSKSAEWLYRPPEGYKLDWKAEGESEWRGEMAKRLVGTITGGQQQGAVTVTLHYAENPLRIVGYEYASGDQTGWCKYLDQQFNPELPKNLGEPPKGG